MYADDLALDLIVTLDGESLVLDEDEFTALEIPPAERERALETLAEFKAMAAMKSGLFGQFS